jgi:hypothetical protein
MPSSTAAATRARDGGKPTSGLRIERQGIAGAALPWEAQMDLTKYGNWIGLSADALLRSVKDAGGWGNVFPKGVPRWANRLRNYFNVTPEKLRRLDSGATAAHMKRVDKVVASMHLTRVASAFPVLKEGVRKAYEEKFKSKLIKIHPNTPDAGSFDDLGESFALSGHVYEDNFGYIWYQMSPGGTIYHWGKDPGKWTATAEAVLQSPTRGQRFIPVFKLVSPDGTGGSRECCIKNDLKSETLKLPGLPEVRSGAPHIGRAVGEWVNVRQLDRVVSDPHYQGSYNYSETVETGLAAHEMRDVEPHKRMGGNYSLYMDPVDRYSMLTSRSFPALDPQGKPLADQL